MSEDMRQRFIDTTTVLLDDDPRLALVLAEISAASFEAARRRHPDRVINVGIREQLMVGVASGLALCGFRPILHTIASFAVARPYEQLKVDLGHQDVGALVVAHGASYDYSTSGRTHQAPEDVALISTQVTSPLRQRTSPTSCGVVWAWLQRVRRRGALAYLPADMLR